MLVRRLAPNRTTDVRWGYLDRFDVGPYWIPSLAVTLFAVACGMVAMRLWPHRGAIVPPAPAHWYFASIEPMPAPLIPRVQVTRPQPVVRQRVTAARLNPVPAVESPIEIDEAAPAAGGDAAADPLAAAETGDPIAAPGAGDAAFLPDPDDFIPVERQPALVAMMPPDYPELARDAGIEGVVLVQALVGADGFVQRVRVVQSVLGLDEAALAAARDAVFRPALQQDRPVAVWVVIPIEFRLRD